METCLSPSGVHIGATTEQRLLALTPQDFAHLRYFASCRLNCSGLPALYAEDLVNKALHSVVKGLQSSDSGRHPRQDELASPDMFLDFLRGAVCSTVEAFSRKRELKHAHQPLIPFEEISLVSTSSPDEDTAWLDLRTELFSRLKRRAPSRLHATILAWEEVFLWSDAIPNVPSARYAYDVRRLARNIIEELGVFPERQRGRG